jgi:hypothetical protein
MKSPVFIDTGTFLALLNTADEHHQRAAVASGQVQEVQQLAGLRSTGLRPHPMRHGNSRIDS